MEEGEDGQLKGLLSKMVWVWASKAKFWRRAWRGKQLSGGRARRGLCGFLSGARLCITPGKALNEKWDKYKPPEGKPKCCGGDSAQLISVPGTSHQGSGGSLSATRAITFLCA